MGARTGAGLKALQFFLRGITFLCAVVVLAIFSFFLANLRHHHVYIRTWVRAVEGLAGAAALYTLLGLGLLWCLAGHTLASAVALFLDVCFIGAFVYIAAANRGGARSCSKSGTRSIRTPYGSAPAATHTLSNSRGNLVDIPSFATACRLEKACLAVAIIAIVFLLLSILTELMLARNHRREKRFGPGPSNNYTSGYGSATNGSAAAAGRAGRGRLGLGRWGKRSKDANTSSSNGYVAEDPNALPLHAQPDQMRHSYATETTAVGPAAAGPTHAAAGADKPELGRAYGSQPLEQHQQPLHQPAAHFGQPLAGQPHAYPQEQVKYGNPPNF